MSEVSERLVWFYRITFFILAVSIISVLVWGYLQNQISLLNLVISSLGLFLYIGLGSLGIRKGVKDLEQVFSYVKEFPEIVTILFTTSLILVVGLLSVLVVLPLILLALELTLLAPVLIPAGILFFIGLIAISSNIAEGAIVISAAKGSNPAKSVLLSLRYIPSYLKLSVYGLLAKSFLGRYFLPSATLSGLTSVALSYSYIITVLEDRSPLEAMETSVQTSLAAPEETSFLNLGNMVSLIVLSTLVLVPMALSVGVMVLSRQIPFLIWLSPLPFLIGLIFFMVIGSTTSTVYILGLLENYIEQ